ncbi:hypothetical protein ACNPQM_33405 [Streptomyces sp. NPDC056231]|uniref:hypothetical protein n=1 Tax=Streptomyces sp. NPDC056231 TaxID=3345755 RepID=UPI003AAD8AF8
MPPRSGPRAASLGAALLVTVLLTGCSNSENPPPDSSLNPPATQNSTPSTSASPEASPEPSPVISYLGKTKIVTLGNTEIRATRNEIGINVACNVTNTADQTRNIKVTVSVGNGKDWVTTNNFDFQQVPAGQTASETAVMGASFEGDLPDDPKIFIDSDISY